MNHQILEHTEPRPFENILKSLHIRFITFLKERSAKFKFKIFSFGETIFNKEAKNAIKRAN